MSKKKKFFIEKNEPEISGMNCKIIPEAENLVQRIKDLNPEEDSICLKLSITPWGFGREADRASRKNLRHGGYLKLHQPYSRDAAINSNKTPLEIRQEAFSRLTRIPQKEINFLGYNFRPITGPNRTRVLVPFWAIMEGCKRDVYDTQVCKELPKEFNAGSEVFTYDNAKRVEIDGASVIVKVPSSTENVRKYSLRWDHISIDNTPEKKVLWWKAKSIYTNGRRPTHKDFNIRFKCLEDPETNDFEMAYPQEVHSYLALAREYSNNKKPKNMIPLEGSQFAIPTMEAVEFWKNLSNNVVILDPNLKQKGKAPRMRRKLHLDERCILMARYIGAKGPEIMSWNRERDGLTKDYNWEPTSYAHA